MNFLSSRVPMSKFGAKVELRCNDGSFGTGMVLGTGIYLAAKYTSNSTLFNKM